MNVLKTKDIRIRDPLILAHDGVYYMYGTNCQNPKVYPEERAFVLPVEEKDGVLKLTD